MLRWMAFALCSFSFLCAEIFKLDEEDLRNLRASDPLDLMVMPPKYAFSQTAQCAKEYGYRYFAFVFYECTFGEYKTTAHFEPPSTPGVLLEYVDEWIRVEFYAYFDPPDTFDVFDAHRYVFYIADHEIDLDEEEE